MAPCGPAVVPHGPMCLLGSWPLCTCSTPVSVRWLCHVPRPTLAKGGYWPWHSRRCIGRAMCPGPLWLKAVIGPGTAGGALALQWPFLPFRSRSMPGSPRYRCPHPRWLVSTARPGYDGFCRVPSSFPAATGAGSSGRWADVTCFSQFGHVTGPFCHSP